MKYIVLPKLIIFDLNKTLIRENSWLELNLAMGVTMTEDDMLMHWSEQGVIDDIVGQTILCNIYKTRGDVSKANIISILQSYTYLKDARYTVAELQKRGYEIALITGSMDILAQHVATELSIKHWRASSVFVFDANDRLTEIISQASDLAYKGDMVRELCDELKITPADCIAVGDGANDAELFKVVGYGITFKGSPLDGIAKNTITELKDLLSIIK